MIKKIGIEKFIIVNIDNAETKIPEFVDRVPALLTSEGHLLVESKITEYLNRTLEVKPFMSNEMNANLSDVYSYIDSQTNDGLMHEYAYLKGEESITIVTPTEEDDRQRIINYDQILEKRDNDLKVILNS